MSGTVHFSYPQVLSGPERESTRAAIDFTEDGGQGTLIRGSSMGTEGFDCNVLCTVNDSLC